MKIFYSLMFVFILIINPIPAYAIETKAQYAVLLDAQTGEVLFDKNAEQQMVPSSMSKLMTVYMVFERLNNKTLSLGDQFRVSEKAWSKQGSKMFLTIDDMISVENLLLGVIVQSGNDACITLAEGLAGSEEAFVESMNKKAKEIGLKDSHFMNASGWPDPEHYMTSLDLAILAKRLINDFPEYYYFFAIKEFKYHNIKQGNRNTLLNKALGVDGLKTGHTEEGGYGITASSVRNNRRLIVVVNGLSNQTERAKEAEFLLNYGFLNTENVVIAKKGEKIADAEVWMGDQKMIPLIAYEDIILTLPKNLSGSLKMSVSYQWPLKTPISKGDIIAHIMLEGKDNFSKKIPITATFDVNKLNFVKRAVRKLHYLIFGSAELKNN